MCSTTPIKIQIYLHSLDSKPQIIYNKLYIKPYRTYTFNDIIKKWIKYDLKSTQLYFLNIVFSI